jgi:hypothetical protein
MFEEALPDVPSKQLVVVPLELPPSSNPRSTPARSDGHRHPGSVYVLVTKGTIKMGIKDNLPKSSVPAKASSSRLTLFILCGEHEPHRSCFCRSSQDRSEWSASPDR